MAQTVDILIRANDQASPVFGKVGKSAGALEKSLSGIGRSAGAGLSNLSSALGQIDTAGAAAASKIAGIGAALLTLGPIAGGVAVAFGLITEQINDIANTAQRRAADIAKPFEEIQQAIEALDKTDPLDSLASSIGLATEQMREFGKASADARQSLAELNSIQAQMAQNEGQIDRLNRVNDALRNAEGFEKVKAVLEAIMISADTASGSAESFERAINAVNLEQLELIRITREAETRLYAEAQAFDAATRAAEKFKAAAGADSSNRKGMGGTAADRGLSHAELVREQARIAADKMASAADKAAAAWERLWGVLKGLVSSSITMTVVTEMDVAATAAGTYVDKWDELRRQAEAVDTGTPVENFENLRRALEETGLSAGEFARQFKSMELFANPVNIKFADMGAIIENVKAQMRAMLGESNLIEAAMKEVWAALSSEEKAQLAEQGIGSAGEAILELIDPTEAAKAKVNELHGAISAVPTGVTTTFTIQQASDWDDVLQDILDDIAKIPTDIGIYVHPVGGGGGAGEEVPDGFGTYGGGQPDMTPPPLYPPGQGPSIAGNRTNNYGNNTVNVNIANAANANAMYREIRRQMGRGASRRAAQGF